MKKVMYIVYTHIHAYIQVLSIMTVVVMGSDA